MTQNDGAKHKKSTFVLYVCKISHQMKHIKWSDMILFISAPNSVSRFSLLMFEVDLKSLSLKNTERKHLKQGLPSFSPVQTAGERNKDQSESTAEVDSVEELLNEN